MKVGRECLAEMVYNLTCSSSSPFSVRGVGGVLEEVNYEITPANLYEIQSCIDLIAMQPQSFILTAFRAYGRGLCDCFDITFHETVVWAHPLL